ncbi:MAG: glycosyltransferase N-terminal domain-containing protein [Bdellovibrionota bacterium]
MILYHSGMAVIGVLAVPFFLLFKRGRFRLVERLGFWNLKREKYLWFHGASLGEVSGLEPVVKALKQKDTAQKILVTSTSSTGLEKAQSFADAALMMPFDSILYYQNALRGLKISALIISETELWPGLLDFAVNRGIPINIINGRISDYTVDQYRRLSWILSPLLAKLTKVVAVNELSKERFKNLGVAEKLISVLPNSKYDRPRSVVIRSLDFKKELFNNNYPTITLGCLRPGEEKIWFSVIRKASDLDLNFIIAPRHKEKFAYFESALTKQALVFNKFSEINSADKSPKIILLDTYGKLEAAYSISEIAFIGATLVDIGGHNPLEAAAYGCTLLVGPYVSTIEELVYRLESDGACKTIKNEEQAFEAIEFLLSSPDKVSKQGELAKKFYEEHQGVSELVVNELKLVGNA